MNIVSLLLSYLKSNWLGLGLVAICAYWAGWGIGWNEQQIRLNIANKQVKQYEIKALKAAEYQAQALAAALDKQEAERQRAEALSIQFLDASTKLANANRQLKRSIPNALKNDGSTNGGLGPDGLWLYRAGLGYAPDTLSNTTGHLVAPPDKATRTDSGLPPADLIAHAADYGQWCQQLEKQLISLRQWAGVN